MSLPPRPTVLAGREKLLADLHIRLADASRGGVRIVTLHGMGGAGKTSLAVEYAHRHQATAAVAWQFPAEDPTVLTAEFARLAGVLGAGSSLLEAQDPVAVVHAVLAASPREWLLVFDNAPDQESVRTFLPPAGTGRILITSQNALWPPGQGIEVPALEPQVAASFLTDRTSDSDEQTATDLAIELGGLPLALEQAAAYIQTTGTSLAQYLDLFRRNRRDLLGRGHPTGYEKTVGTTWALAFTRLGHEAPEAVGLLRLLASCAPEPVPLLLLLQPFDAPSAFAPEVARLLEPLLGDLVAVHDAVAALRRYSLLIPARETLVLVHRLVQAVTVDQMGADVASAWRQAAATLIEAAIPQDTDSPETWPSCAALLPHAQITLPAPSGSMERIADYVGQSGSYNAAREILQKIMSTRARTLGAEHPDHLRAWHDLARWTGKAGDAAGARDQYVTLAPIRARILGPEHPDTLSTRQMLARWTGQAGDPAAARNLLAELLPTHERILGPEHPDTLTSRYSLATWTGKAGDTAAARDMFSELLPIRERILGPEHPDTLHTRHSLACWTGDAGDPPAARDLLAELLPVRERILGPEHPDTLATHRMLARWTGEAGDAAGAQDLLTELLPIRERLLGPEHPNTLATRHSLAHWTGKGGDAVGARDQYATLAPIRARLLGPEHPDTLTTLNTLARWTGEAGDAAAARDMFAELLSIRERLLGVEHPKTLATRHGLAHWTGESGDPIAACHQYAELLPIRERILGPEHPNTLATRAALARWTRRVDALREREEGSHQS